MLDRQTQSGTTPNRVLDKINSEMARLADALERLAPPRPLSTDFLEASAYAWNADAETFRPVHTINCPELALLSGIDEQKDALLRNTRIFALGRQVNNVLLWGARGTGKSSLVKAVYQLVDREHPGMMALIEIQREQLMSLPVMLSYLRNAQKRFIVFADDLSFEADELAYKCLKSVLDGGIEGRPSNVAFYATSNRRHLLSRDMIENEKSTAINPGETTEEKVSLSDRFGLRLGFHSGAEEEFLEIVHRYAVHYGCACDPDLLVSEARQWAMSKGSRSGRTAHQFVLDFQGRL